MVAGEKVAVAPVGKPEMLKVIALGKVVPVAGVSERAKVAVPPGVVVAESLRRVSEWSLPPEG
jgi:hypothetical protein